VNSDVVVVGAGTAGGVLAARAVLPLFAIAPRVGAAGALAPLATAPAMGAEVTITSFAVIVIGSLGNPLGTLLGGLVYGISYMFMQSYYSSWANLLPYLLLIAVLLLRPSGLLGRQTRRA